MQSFPERHGVCFQGSRSARYDVPFDNTIDIGSKFWTQDVEGRNQIGAMLFRYKVRICNAMQNSHFDRFDALMFPMQFREQMAKLVKAVDISTGNFGTSALVEKEQNDCTKELLRTFNTCDAYPLERIGCEILQLWVSRKVEEKISTKHCSFGKRWRKVVFQNVQHDVHRADYERGHCPQHVQRYVCGSWVTFMLLETLHPQVLL
jgi:hypothetical protein